MIEQKHCQLCGSIFLGTDIICRICRKANPHYKMDFEDFEVPVKPQPTPEEKAKEAYYGKVTVESIPFPVGRVHIPQKEPRDYKATIVITTPDILGENFRFCKYRIDKYTPGEHRLVVIETHFNEKPYNYARDINIGFRGVEGSDYLVMLNDDVFVEDQWLDKLVACARQDKKIGIVGALLFFPGKRIIQHAGGNYDSTVRSWASIGQMPVKHSFSGMPIKFSKGEIYKQRDVPWNTGALLLVTKECLDKMGLMDEDLVAHCDDVEFCFRAWRHGFRVVYCPDIQAIHRENITRKEGTAEVPDYIFKATKHLLEVLPKKEADKVQKQVDQSNRRYKD